MTEDVHEKQTYSFDLPRELIAERPAGKRDGSRLLVYRRENAEVRITEFARLPEFLDESYRLVLNDTRVIPARLYGKRVRKSDEGAEVELEALILYPPLDESRAFALATKMKRLRVGDEIDFEDGRLLAQVERKDENSRVLLRFTGLARGEDALMKLREVGRAPLPPYIPRSRKDDRALDIERYQSVFASKDGSIAAPTASLHFTNELLRALEKNGIGRDFITLEVGYGTFQPLKEDDLRNVKLHAERYEISDSAVESINRHRRRGGKTLVVGTTALRALLSSAGTGDTIRSGKNETDIFIYPGSPPRLDFSLLTNFHLPESSLFMLVCATIGTAKAKELYSRAIEEGMRFFSYGDAMLIL
ncbi:MAG: tRNA preQ1(34) S-adenosylmethionine ribosyltransferase-isomerase QueA [Planctomycetes bacterium]|nr:tRNA preQ1(34) S-adenosylmethionine ribosyltransferase-isomerase QueA [Planctomycetota bacterium]